MYKVLFVDDEALVKIGLMSIVDWNALGYDIVGEANDGVDGLKLIETCDPDLVITDIVMPEMDGIEMMKKAKEKGSQAVFVVLSSYDEFDLVRKAMKLGAKDYILKLKVSREVVNEMLEEVQKEWEANPPIKKETVDRVKSKWELDAFRSSFFTDLFSERYDSPETVAKRAGELEICLHENSLRVAYVVTDIYSKASKRDGINEKMFALTIRDLIGDICSEFFGCHVLQWEDGKYIIVFSDVREADGRETITVMLEAVIEMLGKYSNIRASIGISEKVSGYIYLNQAYEQAREVLSNLFIEGYGKILFHDSCNTVSKNEADMEFLQYDRIQIVCETEDTVQFRAIYEKLLKELEKGDLTCKNACFHCSKFMCFVDGRLNDSWKEYEKKQRLDNYLYKIYHSTTVVEIRSIFLEFCTEVYQFMAGKQQDDTISLVREAKRYIRNHICEPISLKEVAEYLHISTGYLSGIFSKYESMSLVNYVNYQKVEEAKTMLKREHLKIYEVSFRLGYENSGYFSKIFKRYAGCTPKEYVETK